MGEERGGNTIPHQLEAEYYIYNMFCKLSLLEFRREK